MRQIKIFSGVSHGLVQLSLKIEKAFNPERPDTITSLSWIRLEVKKESANGFGFRDTTKDLPYSALSRDPEKLEEILTALDSKMEAKFTHQRYIPRI